MTAMVLRSRLNAAIAEWVVEFGEGPSLPVPADLLIGATVETLADLLLAVREEPLRTALARRTHVYLDMCLAADGPSQPFADGVPLQ